MPINRIPVYLSLYEIVVVPSVPSNLNGASLKYSVETGDPQSNPMSRQSFAVKVSGAVIGTRPPATALPLTLIFTSSGDAGFVSASRDWTSITTSPAPMGSADLNTVRLISNRLYS